MLTRSNVVSGGSTELGEAKTSAVKLYDTPSLSTPTSNNNNRRQTLRSSRDTFDYRSPPDFNFSTAALTPQTRPRKHIRNWDHSYTAQWYLNPLSNPHRGPRSLNNPYFVRLVANCSFPTQAQTPQQRRANEKFAKSENAKRGKPQSALKKTDLQKSPVGKIAVGQ